MNERRATARKRAIVALEIHNILDDRSAELRDEAWNALEWRVRTAVEPIAPYISASRGTFA